MFRAWVQAHTCYVASMASYVGLDPGKDIRWVTDPTANPMQLFVDGKVDAFLATPPEPQIMRATQRRAGDPRQQRRPPMVAVFLLYH